MRLMYVVVRKHARNGAGPLREVEVATKYVGTTEEFDESLRAVVNAICHFLGWRSAEVIGTWWGEYIDHYRELRDTEHYT